MSLRKITKVMQLFIQRHRIVSLIFLLSVIFIPILVLATNDVNIGAFIDKGATYIVTHCVTDDRDGSGRCPYGTRTCIRNNSGLNYFVPTRTLTEWNAFLAHLPSSVTPIICDGDGFCDLANGETCNSSPGDCGSCAPTCTSFTYSNWFGCDSSGHSNRAVLSASPSGCIGGSPLTSRVCCSGCALGWKCGTQTVYTSSYCSGQTANTLSARCVSDSDFPYYGCKEYPPVSIYLAAVDTSQCYFLCDPSPTPTLGCPSGSSCRAVTFYPNTSCSGSYYSAGIPYCISDNVSVGSCIGFYPSGQALSYITGGPNSATGCTQASLLLTPSY
jgi:hypothetical protein